MLSELASISIEVENFALVTHRVPAYRVRKHLPDLYQLQTHVDEGVEYCFVTATCFCNRDFRLTALPYPRHTFNESTYRTYVSYRGSNAVFFFGRFLGTGLALGSQRVLARDTFGAEFDVAVQPTADGYNSYECRAIGERGETTFTIQASGQPPAKPPWASGNEHAQFLTYRLDGHFISTTGAPAHAPVKHARMNPWHGRLLDGRFTLWEDLGIVEPDEAPEPYSVLVAAGTRFFLYPPRPAL